MALFLDLAFSRHTFLFRIKLFTKVLLNIWTQWEAEVLTWGLELKEGLVALHGSVTLLVSQQEVPVSPQTMSFVTSVSVFV